jgi:hypothetical protein
MLEVQRSDVQRFQQRAYDLGFRTLKLEGRDIVQADPAQGVTNNDTQHDISKCLVWRAGKPYLSGYIALQTEEVESQIEHHSVPTDTLSHILVMANIIGHFLKTSESDPAEEDYASFVHVSNQSVEYTWGKGDMDTGHPVDIDQWSESDYSTICVSNTAVSEIYSQAQQVIAKMAYTTFGTIQIGQFYVFDTPCCDDYSRFMANKLSEGGFSL